jgi:serpin B
MLFVGAKGDTAKEMATALFFDPSSLVNTNRYDDGFLSLLAKLICKPRAAARLNIANALWLQKGFLYGEEFSRRMQRAFSGQHSHVDFIQAAEDSRKLINAWTEKETNGKIQDLIPQGVLGSETRLVLTNALYFKSAWQSQFDSSMTKTETFFSGGKKENKVPMMHQTLESGSAGYLDSGHFSVLRIAFKNHEQSMFVFLPKKRVGLPELEQGLTVELIQDSMQNTRPAKVDLSLPRFTIEYATLLGRELKSMGMQKAFLKEAADFSGISNGPDPLFFMDVIHKTYIDLKEAGAEASAATATMALGAGSAPLQSNKPILFRADHPFFFVIYDQKAKVVLFMGRYSQVK